MTAAFAVGQRGWNDKLSAATLFHARDTFLPASDQAVQAERDGFAPVPGGVKLLPSFEVNTNVVDLNLATRHSLGAVTNDEVSDHEFSWGVAARKINLRFIHRSIVPCARAVAAASWRNPENSQPNLPIGQRSGRCLVGFFRV